MVRYVVINMLVGLYVVDYLRQKPEAGLKMIEAITHEIEVASKNRIACRQVIVVIGKLYDDGDELEDIPFKRRNTIAWRHYYYLNEIPQKVTQAMDRKITHIIKTSINNLISRYYIWKLAAPLARQV